MKSPSKSRTVGNGVDFETFALLLLGQHLEKKKQGPTVKVFVSYVVEIYSHLKLY